MISPIRPILGAASAAQGLSARTFSTSSPRSLARMIITGRLATTPEVQTSNNGTEVMRYTVVSNHGPRENRQASFFRITGFPNPPRKDFYTALPKGCLVFIEGDASMKQWEDSEGRKHSALNVVQRNFELLKRPNAQYQNQEGQSEGQGDFAQ